MEYILLFLLFISLQISLKNFYFAFIQISTQCQYRNYPLFQLCLKIIINVNLYIQLEHSLEKFSKIEKPYD
jgi:hypothetical protein